MPEQGLKTWVSFFIGLAWLVRLPILLILLFAIALDMRLSHVFSWKYLQSLSLTPLTLYGGAYAFNDYVDRSADRINLPHRPLPAGRLSAKHALLVSLVLLVTGIGWSWHTGSIAFWFAITFLATSTLYSVVVKRHSYWLKNALAALLGASFFGFMAIHLDNSQVSWYLFGAALLLGIAREALMDVRDKEGDERAGISTVATVHGARCTIWFAALFMALGIVWIFGPAVKMGFSAIRLPWAATAVTTIALVACWIIAKSYAHKAQQVFWFVAESVKLYWLVILMLWFWGAK